MANGGYVAGRLAQFLGRAASVTLRRPTPLARDLSVVVEGDCVRLYDGSQVLVEAVPGGPSGELPPAPSLREAQEASTRFPRFVDHPLPRCFVCGPQRPPGDGLRIFPGPLVGRPGVAAPWTPGEDLGDRRGLVREEFLWSALDCAGAFAVNEPPRGLVLLGSLKANVFDRPQVSEPCAVLGWSIADRGRQLLAGTALYGADGRALALAEATWVFVTGPRARLEETPSPI
jgi:hypothetical protein